MRKFLMPLRSASTAGLCLLIAACATPPQNPKPPPPINSPVDAFEAVGQPPALPGTRHSYNYTLTNDVHRLQNAHQAYQQAQERRAAEVQRRQAQCQAKPNSKQVKIQDGSGDKRATYCQPAPGSAGESP